MMIIIWEDQASDEPLKIPLHQSHPMPKIPLVEKVQAREEKR